jgi:small conductance mechanosensitive channel
MEFDVSQFMDQLQNFVVTYGTKVVGAILTLIIGLWIIGRIVKALSRLFEKKDYDPSVESFLLSIVSIGFKILLILAVAGMFGIETTSFIAVFSALAFAVGLALQGNLANFASGILILIFKFYKVGDFVEAAGKSGTVREIKIFHTVLQSLDNSLIIVPNGQVTSNPIQNYTALGKRRHDLTVGIGYDDDIDKAKGIIQEVAENLPNVDKEEGVDIFVKELADSSVNFAVRFVLKNEDFWPAYKQFFEQIKKQLDANEVSIPYPQMDVHVDQV